MNKRRMINQVKMRRLRPRRKRKKRVKMTIKKVQTKFMDESRMSMIRFTNPN